MAGNRQLKSTRLAPWLSSRAWEMDSGKKTEFSNTAQRTSHSSKPGSETSQYSQSMEYEWYFRPDNNW